MPKFYVILVDNYDQENSGSYILDSQFFSDELRAREYLCAHLDEIKRDHWTEDRPLEDDEDFEEYDRIPEEGSYKAIDKCDGMCLEINVIELTQNHKDYVLSHNLRAI